MSTFSNLIFGVPVFLIQKLFQKNMSWTYVRKDGMDTWTQTMGYCKWMKNKAREKTHKQRITSCKCLCFYTEQEKKQGGHACNCHSCGKSQMQATREFEEWRAMIDSVPRCPFDAWLWDVPVTEKMKVWKTLSYDTKRKIITLMEKDVRRWAEAKCKDKANRCWPSITLPKVQPQCYSAWGSKTDTQRQDIWDKYTDRLQVLKDKERC